MAVPVLKLVEEAYLFIIFLLMLLCTLYFIGFKELSSLYPCQHRSTRVEEHYKEATFSGETLDRSLLLVS